MTETPTALNWEKLTAGLERPEGGFRFHVDFQRRVVAALLPEGEDLLELFLLGEKSDALITAERWKEISPRFREILDKKLVADKHFEGNDDVSQFWSHFYNWVQCAQVVIDQTNTVLEANGLLTPPPSVRKPVRRHSVPGAPWLRPRKPRRKKA